MNNYFVSEKFIASMSPLINLFEDNKVSSKNVVGYITGISLKYYMLFNGLNSFSLERLDNFVKKIVEYMVTNNITNIDSNSLDKFVNSEYIDGVLKILNINKEKMPSNIGHEIGKLIAVALERYDYKFHGFNGYFLDSIKENGLNPEKKEEQESIKRINAIFAKYGLDMGLGWSKHDEGVVSYSKTPMVSYDYALRSPEWFSQFTGGSIHHQENKTAFMDNNYEGARYNILKLMMSHNFSREDMATVMEFFVKNWHKYANQKPMIALIEDKQSIENINKIVDMHQQSGYLDDIPSLLPVAFYDLIADCKSQGKIDTTNAKYVELLRHNELIEKMYLYKEQQSEINR